MQKVGVQGRIKEGQIWDSTNIYRGDESMGLNPAFASDLINNLEKGKGFIPQMVEGNETPRFVVNRQGDSPKVEQLTSINKVEQIVAVYNEKGDRINHLGQDPHLAEVGQFEKVD